MKSLIKIISFFVLAHVLTACVVEVSSADAVESSSSSSTSSSASSDSDSSDDVVSSATGSSYSADSYIYINLSDKTWSEDNASWTSITSDSETVSLSDSVVIKVDLTEIEKKMGVVLKGSLSSGGVKIQTNPSYETGLYLNNVTIYSTNYPCVDITKGGAATVFLTGSNVLVDGREYGTGYGSDYESTSVNYEEEGSDNKGSLFCKGGLTICESSSSASLTITQAYKNCIASKDGILTVESGSLSLKNYTSSSETGKNGLFGGQGIIVNGGSITFDGKGIISTSDVRKANAFKTDDENYTSSYVKITGGTVDVTTYNGKGISAPVVAISGGNNTFNVTGTTSYSSDSSGSSKSYSWYDADGVQESGTITYSPEGIEGSSSVSISGGYTIVSAYDDGINVSATGGKLSVSGGFLYVSAKGDGIDSNGNITISDGIVVVSQTGNNNSPIDCGDGSYKFTVTGGTVFAMGGSGMFSESIPSSTSNPMIYSTSLGSSSSSLGVDGIIAVESPQTYAAAILISSSLTSGSSYAFVKGGEISGTEYVSGSGVYYPASLSGGSEVSVTAGTSASSTSHGKPGGR